VVFTTGYAARCKIFQWILRISEDSSEISPSLAWTRRNCMGYAVKSGKGDAQAGVEATWRDTSTHPALLKSEMRCESTAQWERLGS
jgi:hypothetical protein